MSERPGQPRPPGDSERAGLSSLPPSLRAAVFVSDPSAEAERVAQQLRAAGYGVVDVPLAMLAARVAVQVPSVILVDADAPGVSEVLEAVERAGGGAKLDVLLLGRGDRERYFLSAGTFFARPVDATEIVRKVTGIVAALGAPDSMAARALGRPAPGGPRSVAPSPSSPPHPVWADRNSSVPPSAPTNPASIPPSRPPASAPLSPLSARSARPAISIRTSLSAELESLLAEAELRIGSQMMVDTAPPTPEEELASVLPEALLAELDEPIDEDEDDALAEPARSGKPIEAAHAGAGPTAWTQSGRALTPPPPTPSPTSSPTRPPAPYPRPAGEALGVAPTMAAPPMPMELSVVLPEAPLPGLAGLAALAAREEVAPPPLKAPRAPSERPAPPSLLLAPDDAARLLGGSIASRASGCFAVESAAGTRRVVLRDGDIVTAASTADDETLLVFLTTRGDLRQDQVKDLLGKVPVSGRHAGAALVAHGVLRQDDLWPILRAHAEWIVARIFATQKGSAHVEAEGPGRLRQEPSVFGGSSGAEVFVEVARRVIAPEDALFRLGGAAAKVTGVPSTLLAECALDATERAIVEGSRGLSLGELTGDAAADLASVLYALSLLSVITVTPPAEGRGGRAPLETIAPPDVVDESVVRERVRARSELVAEGDYFTLLGVARDATRYEVRRAYLELRRAFEPRRILTPALADLEEDVRTIVGVLDEAYEILRDSGRRERYRRALGDA